jgi:hypothetical protein
MINDAPFGAARLRADTWHEVSVLLSRAGGNNFTLLPEVCAAMDESEPDDRRERARSNLLCQAETEANA